MSAFTKKLHFLLVFVPALVSCSEQDSEKAAFKEKKYSIYAMMKDGVEYIIQTDSLHSGSANPEKQGAKVVPARLFYDLIVQDGNYYRVDWKTDNFIKYSIRNNIFQKDAELHLNGISAVENYNWIGKDSLLILSYDEKAKKARYAKINIKEMRAVQGEIPIPSPSGIYNWMSIGFSKLRNDTLFVGYCYHKTTNLNNYTTSDTIKVEVLTYPAMKSVKRIIDTRSSYPGGVNTRQSHSFTDKKGDFYFIACPGIAAGNNPGKPTGIFRIKKSGDEVDPDYFFNISASTIQNHGYGFWCVGNGKAIVRTERRALFTGMNDHWKIPHFDFYLLDLESKSTTRLDLPLDKGTARQCVLVEDGLAYITVNSDSAGSFVWIYNTQTGSLKKGLHFDKDVDYVLRLERLNR